jgi:NAD(P)-dependent dehydrogenase (short-subunit alcohol dehydrogenase family)
MNQAKPFEGKAALVTGAASGIGRATAQAFAAQGASVALVDLEEEAGERVAAELRKRGARALFVRCNVGKEREIEIAVQRSIDAFGALHIAFNNAGIEGEQAPTAECTNENWNNVIGVNLRGVWHCMKHEIPPMLALGGGAIVNCASIAGLVGYANIPAYVAAKHGVIGLTKTAALEYASHNIRVNAVCPGVIDTPMIERFIHGDPVAHAALGADQPMRRAGRPEEVASAVLWLSGEGASYVTGSALVVDGGWTAH